jgi:hypothetical protein
MGKGWSTTRPGRFTPWKDTRYQLYRRPGGITGPVRTGAVNLTPTDIRSRAVQPVARRYTDYVNPIHYVGQTEM